MTHKEREDRRKAISKYVKSHKGCTMQDVCKKCNASDGLVASACNQFGGKLKQINEQKRDRRRQIAKHVKTHKGCTIQEVCKALSAGRGLVVDACDEFGGELRRDSPFKKESLEWSRRLQIIAMLQNTKLSFSRIGKRFNVTRQRIQRMEREASKAGIKIPSRSLIKKD